MEIDWTSRSIGEWREYIRQAPRANYLQSLPFARAVHLHDKKSTRLGLIRADGEAIGMLAIQEIKLGPVHVIYLYRGPLWFSAQPSAELFTEFAVLFDKTFPRRPLRMRRWLPEWKDGAEAQNVLKESGFRSKSQSYETIWLDLQKSESALRAELKQKWRNALNKGEKTKLQIQTDWSGSTTKLFLARYDEDRKQKKYPGRSARFIADEIATARAFKDVLILWAVNGNEPVAGIMVLLHGNSATYRVGWTTANGRTCNAHNVLLWQAIKTLKDVEIKYFDLGGVEPSTAEGLTHFKTGMGGEVYKVPGIFA